MERSLSSNRNNHFAGIGFDVACDIMLGISDEEAIRLGFAGGEEDMWDAVTREYMLTENENALPPFF